MGQGDYRVAIDTSTLPPNLVQIADPDATLNHETTLLNQTANNLTVDFGYGAAPVPDLTPVITLLPAVMFRPDQLRGSVQCIELLGTDTSGTITLRVPKDFRWVMTGWGSERDHPPGQWQAGGQCDMDAQPRLERLLLHHHDDNWGQTQKNFGFSAAWNSGQTSGKYTASVAIVSGSGGEIRTDNNTDSEMADYAVR